MQVCGGEIRIRQLTLPARRLRKRDGAGRLFPARGGLRFDILHQPSQTVLGEQLIQALRLRSEDFLALAIHRFLIPLGTLQLGERQEEVYPI